MEAGTKKSFGNNQQHHGARCLLELSHGVLQKRPRKNVVLGRSRNCPRIWTVIQSANSHRGRAC